jgi:hypothetical protein
MRGLSSSRSLLIAITMLLASVGPSTARADDQDESERSGVVVRTLSSKPYLVSGGDALVEIQLHHRISSGELRVTLNGRDVAEAFQTEDGDILTGLVTGMTLGRNVIEAFGRQRRLAILRLTNYPITGPMLSGPHLQPYICQTQDFMLPDGTRLGPPLDANCSAATRVNYVYRSTSGGQLRPLPRLDRLPADVAMTRTLDGETVPFVVRVETGTMNRGIYQNAILHDPTSEAAPTPFSPPRGWNRRLMALHGAGCPGGWYIQGGAQGANILDVTRLSEGYALFINSLNHPTNSCNAFLAGETAMMGKEHFIKTFGVPLFTVSTGGSGGAYTSLQIADAFPGLFDGVLISSTFPDALSIAYTGLDGHLLTHYFAVTDPAGFTDTQKVAVSGHKGRQAWLDAANQAQRTDPVPGRVDVAGYAPAVWNPAVPMGLRYHPVTNPSGAHPTIFDVARNIYGVDRTTGFALRPFDNVGVQYGLEALNAGAITPTQFLNLNERIGGYDQDANYVSQRAVGDVGAIRRAQQSALSLGGGGGLASIPVFDISGLFDEDVIYHYQWFHFAARERMTEANGNAANHVMWRGGSSFAELSNPTPESAALVEVVTRESWAAFIRWVEAVAADRSRIPLRQRVIRNRPADLIDGCWTKELNPQFIAEPQTWSREPDSRCNELWPSYSNPRKVAGGPLAANKFKCRLKPMDLNDYAVSFAPDELQRLRGVFPGGVCDWSSRAVGQTPVRPFSSFGPSPVNLLFDVTGQHDGSDRDE